MQSKKLSRFVLITLAVITAISVSGCSLSQGGKVQAEGNKTAAAAESSSEALTTAQSIDDNAYSNIVINDIPIEKKDYIVETKGNSTYILLDSEIFKFTFKMPGLSNIYPDFSTENGQISVSWSDQGKNVMKIDMVEGSSEAYINDSNEPIDITVAPKTADGKLYIPINLFVQSLKMKETYDEALDLTFIHFQDNFAIEKLVGNWSDSTEDLFKAFTDALAGNGALPSFAAGYQFNGDGTYKYMVVGADGFENSLLQLNGKYKIFGDTIIYYDISETYYEGNPLELVRKDVKRDQPFYEFIGNFSTDTSQIQIGDFMLNKVNP